MTNQAIEDLKTYVGGLQDLGHVMGLLSWDMETQMPPAAADSRGKQMGILSELHHQRATADTLKHLLETAEATGSNAPVDKALLREVRRHYDHATKLPQAFVSELTEVTAKAHHVWVEARQKQDFSLFEPLLTKIVAMNRQQADYLGWEGSPLNALMDLFEPGLTVDEVDRLFNQLRAPLVQLVQAIGNSPHHATWPFDNERFAEAQQKELTVKVLETMGFDFKRGRLDKAPHPFCTNFSINDVRLTSRYHEEDPFSALLTAMHEGGHGLVEQQADMALERTPLPGATLGIHESQSRLYENILGRSLAFWTYLTPAIKAMYPECAAMQRLEAQDIFRLVNRVKPSFIRVESDEVTYNLHIMLRYELEKALIENQLQVADLPAAWNEKMQAYLGITPPNDSQGVLQDVHWSGGMIGYFPTYTLGNLYSAQFWHTVNQDNPTLNSDIEQGKLAVLTQWLRDKIHRHGQVDLPAGIVQRVTGQALNAHYFLDYLWDKYTPLYQLSETPSYKTTVS
ncbi:MAG: carboxypeptidase M32 [Vampirovibrionales bacterium]